MPNGIQFNRLGLNRLGLNRLGLNRLGLNGLEFHLAGLDETQLNQLEYDGGLLDAQQKEDFKLVYQYMTECALPEGQSVTLYDENEQPLIFYGALDLAPEWYDGALSSDGEQRVTACLAARSNGNVQPVQISLRGSDIAVSQQEKDIFGTFEGIFWGNVFAENDDDVHIESCKVDGGGLSGRVCAESDQCGFEFLGACQDVCTYDEAAGQYTDCQGSTHIIQTWLNLSFRTQLGQQQFGRIDKNGQVVVQGVNEYAQLAKDPVLLPVIDTSTTIEQLGTYNQELYIHDHGCARHDNGDVLCWGQNTSGQVGNGTVSEYIVDPVLVATDAAQVVIGGSHTCSLRTNGEVFCWGNNGQGQLGIGSDSASRTTPEKVVGLTSVTRLAANSTAARHSCAIRSDSTVHCWGWNLYGTLGDGTAIDRKTPVAVSVDDQGNPFDNVSDVCTSEFQSCARKSDGSMWCWGGFLSSAKDRPSRVTIDPENPSLGVAPGGLVCSSWNTCVIASDSTVRCPPIAPGRYRWDNPAAGSLRSASLPRRTSGLYRPVPVYTRSFASEDNRYDRPGRR